MTATAESMTGSNPAPVDISEIIAQLNDKAMLHAPIGSVQVREGFNPRRYFDENGLSALTESIKAEGVIQPLVVKPNAEKTGFDLIAGERRFRASKAAQLTEIPVIVRLVTDQQALSMAIRENVDREDMSPAEEAKAAHRMVGLCDGDRDEAALALGWSRKKIDSRLSLLHCSEAVLEALEKREIKVGHAELLAGLTKSMQDESLPGIIKNDVSVGDLRKSIGRYAFLLKDAAFDTAQCVKCNHNSSSTHDLFDNHLDSGHCMNRECYEEKTAQFLMAKKESLKEEYPVIWLDTEKPSDVRCFLVREGESGVGKEQYSACQGCAKFGAILVTEKGKEGTVETDICFDISCNKKKVAAYKKESQPKEPVTSSTAAAAKQATTEPKKEKAKAKSTTAETPKRVIENVNKRIHAAAGAEILKSAKMIRVISLIALSDALKASAKDSMVQPVLKEHGVKVLSGGKKRSEKIEGLFKLEDKALGDLIRVFSAAVVAENQSEANHSYDDNLASAKKTLTMVEADMTEHFVIDQDYLETLTISGLFDLMTESGFIKWYESQENRKKGDAQRDILKGKRDEQIAAIIKAGFNWKGFVPKTVSLT